MQIILDTHFKHIEHFLDRVQHWDLDFKLLGIGGFEGSVKQLASQNVLLAYARFHRGLDQTGATPPGFRTYVILGHTCSGFRWRGHQITQNDLLIFPDSNELHSASHMDFEVFTVSIHLDYIEQLSDDFGLSTIPNKLEVLHMDAHTADELRSLAAIIVQSSGGEAAQVLAYKLTEKIVIAAAETRPEKMTTLRKRDMAVDKVVEFVRSTPNPTSELAQLCRIANVSERTLQYAFKERYGIAPYTFVKRWNLNTARRQILLDSPGDTTINKICMDLNFMHQGQFAADYRKLFAELPSETLNRLNP